MQNNAVSKGKTVTLNVMNSPNYMLDYISIDGVKLSSKESYDILVKGYTFDSMNSNHIVIIVWTTFPKGSSKPPSLNEQAPFKEAIVPVYR